MKFTFKIVKINDWYSYTEIKLKRKVCGTIYMTKDFNDHRIGLKIEKNEKYNDNNPNCKWMNILIKKGFQTETEAREWLQMNIEGIMKNYILHFEEN